MRVGLAAPISLCILLCACGPAERGDAPHAGHGRFSGIGIYDAGPLWGKMATPSAPKDPQLARIADDEHVIVVIDGRTGEVRQCGDHSGYCVSMAPWKRADMTVPQLPVKLAAHAEDLERNAAQAAAAANDGKR